MTSRCGSLLLDLSADERSPDDVIAFEDDGNEINLFAIIASPTTKAISLLYARGPSDNANPQHLSLVSENVGGKLKLILFLNKISAVQQCMVAFYVL